MMTNNIQDNPDVIAPPPLIYAVGLAIGLLLHIILPLRFLPKLGGQAVLGGTLMGLAVMIARQGFRDMQHVQPIVIPMLPAMTLPIVMLFGFVPNQLYISL